MVDASADDGRSSTRATDSHPPYPGTHPTLAVVIAVLSFVLVFLVLVHYLNTPTATVAAVLAAVPGILWAALGWRHKG
jgi:Flp pilus assembly protein TadB